MEFLTPVDIGNRALQHCGQDMLDSVLGFTEGTKAARQVSFCYGKLRRAELRRNVWRFATRKAVLRAIDTNTLLLSPSLWVASTTYFVGSIVTDDTGTYWISNTQNNMGNQPQNSLLWEPYFGPLTVMLYDSSTSYYSGELVYGAAGDGTYNTYMSLVNGNAVHPALPNQWSTFTTYFRNQIVQQFPAWAGGTTYTQGQTVSFTDGNVYSSLQNGNIGHSPSTSPTFWALVPTLTIASQPVPLTTTILPPQTSPVFEWQQTVTYALGSFVMFNGTEYLSIQANNIGNFPNAAASTFWKPLTLGTFYMSLIDLNIGNNPATTFVADWASGTTYAAGNKVTGSDGVIYSSIGNGNLGHDPVLTVGFWTNTGVLSPWDTTFVQGGGNQQWMQVGGASFPSGVGLSGLNFTYPINSGPTTQLRTRNVFRLPAGYLREADQDPKAGSTSPLGAESGLAYPDWEFEGNFIVSRVVTPIVYRFVADVTDVRQMDDMFCEGLAARIALEVCEPLTQSVSKVELIAKEYEKFMSEARIVNGIETGSVEPPVDDYIQCRL